MAAAVADFDWSQTTFEGVRRRQSQTLATATPAERLALLEQLLELALAGGALVRVREARQRAVERAWSAS